MFHYNKAHNSNNEIPQWVIKFKGESYYIHHLESNIGFKTKETPNNPHTKGSIIFKGKLKIIDNNGIFVAYIN